MNFLIIILSQLLSCVASSQNPYGGYPTPYGQGGNDPRYQQQQQPYPQQQRPNYPPDPRYQNRGQPPPSSYNSQAITPYGRGPPPGQQEGGGLFSKLKSSIFAAGSAISESFQAPDSPFSSDGGYTPQYPPPVTQRFPPTYGPDGRPRPPPGTLNSPPQIRRGPPSDYAGPPKYPPYPPPGFRSTPPPPPAQEGGIFSKIKNLFGSEEEPEVGYQQPQRFPPGMPPPGMGAPPPGMNSVPPGYPRMAPPPPGFGPPQGPPQGQGPPPGFRAPPAGAPGSGLPQDSRSATSDPRIQPGIGRGSFEPYGGQAEEQGPPSGPAQPTFPSSSHPSRSSREEMTADSVSKGLESEGGGSYPFPRDPFSSQQQGGYPQQQQQQQQQQPEQQQQPSFQQQQSQPQLQQQGQGQYGGMYNGMYGAPSAGFPSEPVMPVEDPLDSVSPEPKLYIHEGSIIMILNPRQFYKKKMEMTQAGPQSIQVLADFEHVFTSFHTSDGARTLGTAELLENSGALTVQATQQLSTVADEYGEEDLMEEGAFESLTAQCQSIVAEIGALHIAAVSPVTREGLPKLGLREGGIETLKSLASLHVPTYLFSAGYGDVVAQSLLQSGLSAPEQAAYGGQYSPSGAVLPQNLRIISNFFRTAPDGTVRAFSQPIVHERNKNASTASRFMGMRVPGRPYALVLGSHEDDVYMSEGISGIKEQLSIGFLELTEDLTQRLPTYLGTFDAVVVGDGNFKFIQSLVHELLQLPEPTSSSTTAEEQGAGLFGLRKGLGRFLQSQPQTPQQAQQAQPPAVSNFAPNAGVAPNLPYSSAPPQPPTRGYMDYSTEY